MRGNVPDALELILARAPGPHTNEAPTLRLDCRSHDQKGWVDWGSRTYRIYPLTEILVSVYIEANIGPTYGLLGG